jgi:signal transduction histidine kinase
LSGEPNQGTLSAGTMRLASKIFLTSSLLIVVLAGVGVLSLRAVGRLASVNRELTYSAVPAVRLGAGVREAMGTLARLEARFVILQDLRYATLWDETARGVDGDLERLGAVLTTAAERGALDDARAAFADYRRLVERQRALVARGERRPALSLVETDGRVRLERVEAALGRLAGATDAAMEAAEREMQRLERRTWTGVLVALGGAVILALAGTGLIAFRMTRSLRRLSAATTALAQGSFEAPLDVRDRDEVGELARSFDAMATELRQLDRTKEEFFAMISHELRSPLTSIVEATHLLRDEVAGPMTAKQARLAAIIASSSDRLLRLVNRILEVSRLRAGVLPLAREAVDVAHAVDRALEELRPQAEEGGVTLGREQVGTDFTLVGDEERLVQVIVNLLANAVRFTPRGGTVSVRLVDAGPEVEIHVEDTGVGIAAPALPGIFEPYRQAQRDRRGSGLGLSIVRGVVEAHGGRVTVESQEGKGSRFTVVLPRTERAPRDA